MWAEPNDQNVHFSMSGIAGIVRFDGGPVDRGLLFSMTQAMSHRGPDGINHWFSESVALGQCMLRTTPESLEEIQPLSNEDESLVLVMDGRVDNWEELRRELLTVGARLRTRSDAELVLRAYEAWGQECLPHLDGDFAFALWDTRKRELFCARDRIGNKPFTYYWDGATLLFASELHAILKIPGVPQILNEDMVAEHLADEWLSFDETLWRGLMRLPGAHAMNVGNAGPRLSVYWQPSVKAVQAYASDDEYLEHYRSLFADCVRRLSRSHRPVAYHVSGGLDSSAVFCMAENLRRSGTLPAPNVQGYAVAVRDFPEANEVYYSRLVGSYLGVTIKEGSASVKDLAWYKSQADFYRDFPGFPLGTWDSEIQAMAVSDGSRVVLTGFGGDQFLAGSGAHYAEELSQRNWKNVYRCWSMDFATFGVRRTAALMIGRGLLPLLPEGLKKLARPIASRTDARNRRDSYWLTPEMKARLAQRKAGAKAPRSPKPTRRGQIYLLQALYYAFDAYGRELTERSSARIGIEVRHPFYSAEFVNFALATPERLRSGGRQGKHIHVNGLGDILPPEIRARTAKADFESLAGSYLRTLQNHFVNDYARNRPSWITNPGSARLFRSFLEHPDEGWQIWVLSGMLGCDLVAPKPTC
jgi:asparagine synthase (glutamine-hydrolysing)